MSTTLAITFPWGRYHATPWGRHANEGAVEWPPSPWRLLRGLYATWLARAPHLPATVVHGLLADLVDPPSFLLPPYVVAHTRHFMPDATHMRDMPKRGQTTAHSDDAKDLAFDTFTVFPSDRAILVTWPVDLDSERRSALAELAELLPYVGRAESICAARLADANEVVEGGLASVPLAEDGDGSEGDPPPVRVLVPRSPLDTRELVTSTVEVRKQRLLDPPGARRQLYSQPAPNEPRRKRPAATHRRPTAIRWSMAAPALPSVRAAVAMADVLRRACLARFGSVTAGGASAALAGKDSQGVPLRDHEHAHYLALDEDRDGLLDHLVVWAPTGLGDDEVAALSQLSRLAGFGHVRDFRPTRLGLEAIGEAVGVVPGLVGPALAWRSVTPFAPSRHARRGVGWDVHVRDQVEAELRWRGLPRPVEIGLIEGDWLSFRRHRPTTERLEEARRASGVQMRFAEPVSGPLVLGSLSHFGLGLFEALT